MTVSEILSRGDVRSALNAALDSPPLFSLVARLARDVSLLTPEYSAALVAEVWRSAGSRSFQAAEHPAITKFREVVRTKLERAGPFAVVPVKGVLANNPDPFEQAFFGVEDSAAIRGLVEQAAADGDVSGILLNVESPGGFYTGGPEVADSVRLASAIKPVVAWTGGEMASLAYWIGSQADKVVASRSAAVGSIGVYRQVVDVSKLYDSLGVKVEVFANKEGTHKTAGMPGTTLTEDQRAEIQRGAQQKFREFSGAVRAKRPDVSAEAMDGRVFSGSEARSLGLVDALGGMGYALGVLKREVSTRNRG